MRNFLLTLLLFTLNTNLAICQSEVIVGTINGLPVTSQELNREMLNQRSQIYRTLNNNDKDPQQLIKKLKKAAFDSLILIKVQENLLKNNGLWPYKNYQALLTDLSSTNKARQEMVAKKQFFVGTHQFSEDGFFNYQFTNSLIGLKLLLIKEGLLKITQADLEAQFKLLQQTVYKEEKYKFEEYVKQVRDSYIERAYANYINSLAKSAKVAINQKAFAAIVALKGDRGTPPLSGNYYVDAIAGNDANTGKTPQTAWKSIEKLNKTTFKPGDRILLKAGSRWVGSLHPKGSGMQGNPIVLSSYGDGPKPLIDGLGMEGKGVFSLYNQHHWEVSNLELTNDAATPGDRRGVEVKAANAGVLSHIYLKNLDIHHIKGLIGNGHKEKRTSGIYITTESDKAKPTRFDDILIEGCTIHHIENQGIATSHETAVFDYPGTGEWENRKLTGLLIRNNTIHHISKNAMIIRMAEGGVVENNLCYETALAITGNTIFSRTLRGTVFQFNEGYLNRSPDADGSLYDPDINSPNTIWQYSYSHDNAHGLVWFCTEIRDDNIIVRYNLSKNDKGNLVYFNYAFTGASVYNNVFYTADYLSPTIIREKGTNPHSYSFKNNIIYNLSNKATYKLAKDAVQPQNRMYANNIFFGVHPEGEPKGDNDLRSDPLFMDLTIKDYLKQPWGFQLKNNSPAFKAGKPIEENGGRDFFGNVLKEKANPAIGFDNGK